MHILREFYKNIEFKYFSILLFRYTLMVIQMMQLITKKMQFSSAITSQPVRNHVAHNIFMTYILIPFFYLDSLSSFHQRILLTIVQSLSKASTCTTDYLIT